jgi:hypothetical protein
MIHDFKFFGCLLQGWPNKMVMFSFLPSENASKPVDIFYGAQDANVGGFQVLPRFKLSL